MKLQHKGMVGQKLSMAGGKLLTVDAEGVVDVEDKELAEQLRVVGFKPLFRKDPKEKVEEPKEPESESEPKAVEPESEPKAVEPETEPKPSKDQKADKQNKNNKR